MQPQPVLTAPLPYGTELRHRDAARSDGEALARLIADGRVSPEIAVTCWDRVDGIGAQATGVISAMVLARFAGCRYLHSPFARVDHVIGDPADWTQLWERFLNLGDGESRVPEDAERVRLSAFVQDPIAYAGRNMVIAEARFGYPRHALAPVQDALRVELRAKYWRSPKMSIRSHRAPRGLTAAVHLRRGDVHETSQRYVSEDRTLHQVLRLRQALAIFGRPVTINLYSEGAPEDFRAFAEAGCILHVSSDPFETFHNMVTADILMTGHSSFSRFAALLSEGVIVHDGSNSPRLSNHLHRRPNGDIPIKALRRALIRRMTWWEKSIYWVRRSWHGATAKSAP